MTKLGHLFYQVTPESHFLIENNCCWYVGGSAQNILPAHNPVLFRFYWELGISLFSWKLRYILQPGFFHFGINFRESRIYYFRNLDFFIFWEFRNLLWKSGISLFFREFRIFLLWYFGNFGFILFLESCIHLWNLGLQHTPTHTNFLHTLTSNTISTLFILHTE